MLLQLILIQIVQRVIITAVGRKHLFYQFVHLEQFIISNKDGNRS